MIVRTHFVLLTCWMTGHSADGLYLKYKLSPNTTELTIETLQHGHGRIPREVGHWIYRNRKKLVILDRKNKYVAAFIQKLINLLEKEKEGDKPKAKNKFNSAQLLTCYRGFGNLIDSRFKKCRKGRVTVKPVLKLMTVNVIPVKADDDFVDSTRHGSDDDDKLFSDTDSSSDTSDFTESDNTKEEKIVPNLRKQGQPLFRASLTDWSNEHHSVDETYMKSKRFEVVNNGHARTKQKIQNFSIQEKQSSEIENVSDDEKDQKYFSDSDFDVPKSKEQHRKQKKKPNKTKYPSLSSDERGDISEEESSKNKKVKKNTGKYIYLQGSKPVNSDMEESDGEAKRDSDGEAKRDSDDEAKSYSDGEWRRSYMNRLRDFFMPKRNIWDSDEIQHLSYYWFNGPQGHVIYS